MSIGKKPIGPDSAYPTDIVITMKPLNLVKILRRFKENKFRAACIIQSLTCDEGAFRNWLNKIKNSELAEFIAVISENKLRIKDWAWDAIMEKGDGGSATTT
jgi:hypothetical protein